VAAAADTVIVHVPSVNKVTEPVLLIVQTEVVFDTYVNVLPMLDVALMVNAVSSAFLSGGEAHTMY
jgi:hypothetical protein